MAALMVFLYHNGESDYTDIVEKCKLDETYLCVIGGDGTLLRALRHFKYGKVPRVLAFNNGRVGFLLPLKLEKLEETLERAAKGLLKTLSRTRIHVMPSDCLVSNEVVMKSDHFQLNRFTVRIDNEFDLEIRGSELVISTSAGSTGYNSSIGGPVVFGPQIIINCVAPNRCNFRPIVLSGRSRIRVVAENCICYFDGNRMDLDSIEISGGDTYKILVEECYSEYQKLDRMFYIR